MDALTAAIRDNYDEKIARLHRIIAEQDGLIHEKGELLSAANKKLSDAYEVIRMLRSELAARDNS